MNNNYNSMQSSSFANDNQNSNININDYSDESEYDSVDLIDEIILD